VAESTVLLSIVVTVALAGAPAERQQRVPTPTPAPSPDPASSVFPGPAGLLLVAIKPAATADYEAVIRLLQDAMAKTTDPQRQRVAQGWHVYKAAESDAKGNVLYVHVLTPAEPGFDYRVSLLVDEMVPGLQPDLLAKYRDAFAGPPTKLSLTELAHMALAPVK
jgi:hypothetical protein